MGVPSGSVLPMSYSTPASMSATTLTARSAAPCRTSSISLSISRFALLSLILWSMKAFSATLPAFSRTCASTFLMRESPSDDASGLFFAASIVSSAMDEAIFLNASSSKSSEPDASASAFAMSRASPYISSMGDSSSP